MVISVPSFKCYIYSEHEGICHYSPLLTFLICSLSPCILQVPSFILNSLVLFGRPITCIFGKLAICSLFSMLNTQYTHLTVAVLYIIRIKWQLLWDPWKMETLEIWCRKHTKICNWFVKNYNNNEEIFPLR